MSETSLIVGAGVIGSRVAGMLAERGNRVIVVSRHGSAPAELRGVTRAAADAADAGAMARLAEGVSVIYNCVNPPYHRWPTDWPPIAASVLAAAERSGAVLVTLSNLYGYGPRVPGGYDEAHPMTEATRLAATGRKGRVRARGQVRTGEIPSAVLRGMGLVWPLMRELRETEYQFRDDFVMDSAAARAAFGLKPAPWEEILAVTVRPASR